ncbi:beta-Ala-His dipeptidase isoform X2 [Rousettus aegyptiacus]|uniref:beta-Ala-His dipeptidase isoform X2 n=2 Tax=Rousettus aegyptiacus TaxID=9407 RepID=UPI00168CD635|nr:beta-Ala-His dipeptidase isoform X2 [Rousettus aegyptiacus]
MGVSAGHLRFFSVGRGIALSTAGLCTGHSRLLGWHKAGSDFWGGPDPWPDWRVSKGSQEPFPGDVPPDNAFLRPSRQTRGVEKAAPLLLLLLLPRGGGMSPSPSLASASLLRRLSRHIDRHQDEFVQTLREWVAVESDSIQPMPRLRQELLRMMALAADRLRCLGASVEAVDVGSQKLPDGDALPMPPVLLAELGSDPQKATVCFYGHLDVQPARQEDGWLADPYALTEVDGKLYGRGATDNKGPVLAWINAVGAFRALQEDLPVNIKFIVEGMEEAGSPALEELIRREKDRFFSGVDYIVISDNLWISQRKPALIYGTRGNSYFTVEVKCRDQDFHSGTFGGILNEPMADLVALLGSLVDASGRILVPGIYDHVAPVTDEEREMYEAIDLDLEEYRSSSRVKKFLFDTKEEVLMHLWRYPSLSIHGVEGAFDKPGAKTVIPGRVTGKFSIRLVPHMNLPVVERQVKQHLQHIFSKRNSSNQMTVSMVLGLHPWVADVRENQYRAARRAIKTVFGTEPDMIRDGSTIPIAKIFQDVIQKSVLMLPLGAVDDGEHSQNEKINRWNYIEGSKLFAAFFLEMAKLHE